VAIRAPAFLGAADEFVVLEVDDAEVSLRRCVVPAESSRDRAALRGRIGFSTLDYVLSLGIVLPLLAVILPQGRRAMQLVFEMTTTLVAWPFM
jgi:hypothetical protein